MNRVLRWGMNLFAAATLSTMFACSDGDKLEQEVQKNKAAAEVSTPKPYTPPNLFSKELSSAVVYSDEFFDMVSSEFLSARGTLKLYTTRGLDEELRDYITAQMHQEGIDAQHAVSTQAKEAYDYFVAAIVHKEVNDLYPLHESPKKMRRESERLNERVLVSHAVLAKRMRDYFEVHTNHARAQLSNSFAEYTAAASVGANLYRQTSALGTNHQNIHTKTHKAFMALQ